MGFTFKRLEIPGPMLVVFSSSEDVRGRSSKIYTEMPFSEQGIDTNFVEDYESLSHNNVIRGMHFQHHPFSEGKLVRIIEGEVFDVVADIRKGSPYYGKWVSNILSREANNMIWIPPGFAHGFLTRKENTRVLYKLTVPDLPEHQGGIIWNDPDLGIEWPLKSKPIVSPRDEKLPPFKELIPTVPYG